MIVHHLGATMPGLVSAHKVAIGDSVAEGDPIMVVETMKCEWPVPADREGRIGWLAPVGAVVAAGDDLARIEERGTLRPPPPDRIIELLLGVTPDDQEGPLGSRTHGAHFTELDLDVDPTRPDQLVKVPPGRHERQAGIVVGRISHKLAPHRIPVERVWLCGDATRSFGAVAEPECRRIVAAIDLAERERLPLEWVAVSAGAKISMNSGAENMDWCAAVVRRLIEFTQAGGEVVIVVAGTNVGAQSYWNAEATMLMHCAGMLVMVEGSAMVLTGHRALARAGGVRERSDHDLGGTGVMTANGQAHHRVGDLVEALALVLDHHGLCASGPCHPQIRFATLDSPDRDVCEHPLPAANDPQVTPEVPTVSNGTVAMSPRRVGDVLDAASNPRRTVPFGIEPVMRALVDIDAPILKRWEGMTGASGAGVWDTRIDGWPITLIGIESRPRHVDGRWEAAGTLYPIAARKVARALVHASGRRPAVVLANLAGFDGGRESLLSGQLEHGAELARAVVNFSGPLVVVVIGRFHGGAYVVFSRRLNPRVRMVALEGTRVSVIGGSAAAEVVLRREVDNHLAQDPSGQLTRDEAVRAVADEFDRVHDVHRAQQTGSVEQVIAAAQLRPTVAALVSRKQRFQTVVKRRNPTPPPAARNEMFG